MAHLLMIDSWVGGNGVILPHLLKELGHTYTFVTRNRAHYHSDFRVEEHAVIKYADTILEVDTNNTDAVLAALPHRNYDGVITTCDYYIKTVSEIAERLQLSCPFPKTVETVRHKQKMRQALDQAGLPNAQYRLAYNWGEVVAATKELGYPLVLKPVDLASSAFVRLIRNKEDLQDAFKDLEAFPRNFRDQERDCTYLLEEYMVGNEVSVEAVSFAGETKIIGITQKSLMGDPYFVENGHMFQADLPEDLREEICKYVESALQAVGYDHGVSHTEVKLTEAGPRIVEINPRTAGGYIAEIIEMVCGVNILKAFVDLSINEKPAVEKIQTGVTSACVMFLTPTHGGKILRTEGAETLENDPHIVMYEIEECKDRVVGPPIDNAGRLGHTITKDETGYRAMEYARDALNRVKLIFE